MVLNLFVLEALLSVDNAAVLAVLVEGLPGDNSKKALKYGIWGAYIMRGGCLFIASWLVGLWYLKVAGGIYLLYLTYGHFSKARDTVEEDVKQGREQSKMFQWVRKHTGLSELWATIVLVEIMDIVFSIDNIFASVALSNKIWVIFLGVFIGIAAMRWVAMWFVDLMRRYPSLERSAYIVIGLLGLKLIVAGIAQKVAIWAFMSDHWFDLLFSIIMMAIFFFPLLRREPIVIGDIGDDVVDRVRQFPFLSDTEN